MDGGPLGSSLYPPVFPHSRVRNGITRHDSFDNSFIFNFVLVLSRDVKVKRIKVSSLHGKGHSSKFISLESGRQRKDGTQNYHLRSEARLIRLPCSLPYVTIVKSLRCATLSYVNLRDRPMRLYIYIYILAISISIYIIASSCRLLSCWLVFIVRGYVLCTIVTLNLRSFFIEFVFLPKFIQTVF